VDVFRDSYGKRYRRKVLATCTPCHFSASYSSEGGGSISLRLASGNNGTDDYRYILSLKDREIVQFAEWAARYVRDGRAVWPAE
jgi:hypothetical protein